MYTTRLFACFFVCRCLLACHYCSVTPETCQVVGSFVVRIQQSRPLLYYLLLVLATKKQRILLYPNNTLRRTRLLLLYNTCCFFTTKDLDSSMGTVDNGFSFYFLLRGIDFDPSMSNGAMLPREFPGLGHLLDKVFPCRMVFIW